MKKWTVVLPVAGSVTISRVEAKTEKEAIDKALETEYKEDAHDLALNQVRHFVQRNVCYAVATHAEAVEES